MYHNTILSVLNDKQDPDATITVNVSRIRIDIPLPSTFGPSTIRPMWPSSSGQLHYCLLQRMIMGNMTILCQNYLLILCPWWAFMKIIYLYNNNNNIVL